MPGPVSEAGADIPVGEVEVLSEGEPLKPVVEMAEPEHPAGEAPEVQEAHDRQEQVLRYGLLVVGAAAAQAIAFLVAGMAYLSARAARSEADQAAAVRVQEERRLVVEQARLIEARAALLVARREDQMAEVAVCQKVAEQVRLQGISRQTAPVRRTALAQRTPVNGGDQSGWPIEQEVVDVTDLPVAG